jgi:hypothetical protein
MVTPSLRRAAEIFLHRRRIRSIRVQQRFRGATMRSLRDDMDALRAAFAGADAEL